MEIAKIKHLHSSSKVTFLEQVKLKSKMAWWGWSGTVSEGLYLERHCSEAPAYSRFRFFFRPGSQITPLVVEETSYSTLYCRSAKM